MTKGRCLAATAAVIGIFFVTDFLIHGVMLKGAYEATAALWRPMMEMQKLMWAMWLIYIVNGLVLPHLYSKGYEAGKGNVGQGVRFGALIGLLAATGMSLGNYMMIPMPGSLAATWFVVAMVQYILVGTAIALIHQPKTA